MIERILVVYMCIGFFQLATLILFVYLFNRKEFRNLKFHEVLTMFWISCLAWPVVWIKGIDELQKKRAQSKRSHK